MGPPEPIRPSILITPNPMTRIVLILTALALGANAIAGSCYVRKACLAVVQDSALCTYQA